MPWPVTAEIRSASRQSSATIRSPLSRAGEVELGDHEQLGPFRQRGAIALQFLTNRPVIRDRVRAIQG